MAVQLTHSSDVAASVYQVVWVLDNDVTRWLALGVGILLSGKGRF